MTVDFWTALEATWPAAEVTRDGPWVLRRGLGGGKRVSAASVVGTWDVDEITLAEAAMAAMGQSALFVLRDGDDALDLALAARGYAVVNPVVIYGVSVADVAGAAPARMTTFAHWPGLRVTADIWDICGIGPARRAVMARVAGPKAVVLGRLGDRAAGVAFVAVAGTVAMVHALEVLPTRRRQGLARNLMRAAAVWSHASGAQTLALAVTADNHAARALYASLGMMAVGQYHYRAK